MILFVKLFGCPTGRSHKIHCVCWQHYRGCCSLNISCYCPNVGGGGWCCWLVFGWIRVCIVCSYWYPGAPNRKIGQRPGTCHLGQLFKSNTPETVHPEFFLLFLKRSPPIFENATKCYFPHVIFARGILKRYFTYSVLRYGIFETSQRLGHEFKSQLRSLFCT